MPFDAPSHPPDAAGLLAAECGHLRADALVAALASRRAGRVVLVSSFGADSAVLLAMVAAADRAMPVLFLDTGFLFAETRAHREALVGQLGLTGVRAIGPDAAAVASADPGEALWYADPDACCALRKVAPLARALAPFDVVLTGRRRHQAATRAAMPRFERDLTDAAGMRVKVNPLADWSPEEVAARLRALGLPPHPLVAQGFPSIGCIPCTTRVRPGEDARAGRWRGRAKTECGIHAAAPADQGPASGARSAP